MADAQYRFIPTVLHKADLARIHGTDERIPVAAYKSMVDFYRDLVRMVDAVEVAVEPRQGDARPCP